MIIERRLHPRWYTWLILALICVLGVGVYLNAHIPVAVPGRAPARPATPRTTPAATLTATPGATPPGPTVVIVMPPGGTSTRTVTAAPASGSPSSSRSPAPSTRTPAPSPTPTCRTPEVPVLGCPIRSRGIPLQGPRIRPFWRLA